MKIRYLILVLTTRCNLSCRYCYNGTPAEPADMSDAVLKEALALTESGGIPFHVQLTGGEPSMVPALMESAVKQAGQSDLCTGIGVQTNGTCLTPALLKLFREYEIQVGVSLDGPPKINERQRGMTGETLGGLRMLEEEAIPFRVTTVVTGENAAFLDRLVLSLGGFSQVRGIGLDLLVDKGRAVVSPGIAPAGKHSLKNGITGMIHALDFVNASRRIPIRLREKDMLFKRAHTETLAAGDARKTKFDFCHACRGESAAVYPDGGLFPCGQTAGDSRFSAGTVWNPLPGALTIPVSAIGDAEKCRSCDIRAFCPGDCPSRLYYNRISDREPACELYRALWKAADRSRCK